NSLFNSFYSETMRLILQEDTDALFMFYNQDMVYQIDTTLLKYILCPNAQDLLRTLNNKMLCKLWLKEFVPLLPSVQMFGSEVSLAKLEKHFSCDRAFVIQPDFSSGGHNTYLLTAKNETGILKKLN